MILRRISTLLERWPDDSATSMQGVVRDKTVDNKRKGRSPTAHKAKAQRGHLSQDAMPMEGDGEDDDEGEGASSPAPQATIGRPRPSQDAMLGTLAALVCFLHTHALRTQPDVLEPVAQMLVAVTHIAAYAESASLDDLEAEPRAITSPTALAYRGLWLLSVGPPSTEQSACLHLVFRHMLTSILLKFQGASSSASIPRAIQRVGDLATAFVCRLVRDGFGAPMARTLIHHLCMGVIDRVEYRAHTAKSVVDIWLALPRADAAGLLPWLQRLARNARAACRGFALDVALELLSRAGTGIQDDALAILFDLLARYGQPCALAFLFCSIP